MIADGAPLRGLYYALCPASEVAAGQVRRILLAGEPLAVARRPDGTAFAVRDICPHRAAPFSAGRVCADGTLECPYHGWRFNGEGRCTRIPALGDEAAETVQRFAVRSFAVHEDSGVLWVYLPEGDEPAPAPALPLSGLGAPLLCERVLLPCGIDDAVIGLMDPAHGPFVHRSFFWRNEASIHRKSKRFAPASGPGFVMCRHAPSRNAAAYKILGGAPSTEITFWLPGIRVEEIRVGNKRVVGLTCVTPREAGCSEVLQFFYTDLSYLRPLRPLLRRAVRHFLGQDADIMRQQARNAAYAPRMMLLEGADTQAKWYYKLRREWSEARAEGRAFVNPVSECELVWHS